MFTYTLMMGCKIIRLEKLTVLPFDNKGKGQLLSISCRRNLFLGIQARNCDEKEIPL
jgi:hypothetical protein